MFDLGAWYCFSSPNSSSSKILAEQETTAQSVPNRTEGWSTWGYYKRCEKTFVIQLGGCGLLSLGDASTKIIKQGTESTWNFLQATIPLFLGSHVKKQVSWNHSWITIVELRQILFNIAYIQMSVQTFCSNKVNHNSKPQSPSSTNCWAAAFKSIKFYSHHLIATNT